MLPSFILSAVGLEQIPEGLVVDGVVELDFAALTMVPLRSTREESSQARMVVLIQRQDKPVVAQFEILGIVLDVDRSSN